MADYTALCNMLIQETMSISENAELNLISNACCLQTYKKEFRVIIKYHYLDSSIDLSDYENLLTEDVRQSIYQEMRQWMVYFKKYLQGRTTGLLDSLLE